MKAYLRFSPLFDEHKAHYSDGQFRAFMHTVAKASRQEPRGRFDSEVKLRALLGRLARHAAFLVEQGDIAVQSDGSVYVTGWDEWQEGDLTVRDRMAALRNRKRNGAVTEAYPTATRISVSVGSDSSRITTTNNGRLSATERQALVVACSECGSPVGEPCRGVRAERNGEPWQRWAVHRPRWEMSREVEDAPVVDGDDLWRLYSGITRSARLKPSTMDWLERLETTYTAPTVAAAMRAAYLANPDLSTLLSRTESSCLAAAKRAEGETEKKKRSARIVDGMVARRLETYRNTGKWDEAWGPVPE